MKNNAEKYFSQQKQNPEFIQSYNEISEQIDIEWELERVKNQIQDNMDKNLIIAELEKLQNFVHKAIFTPKLNRQQFNKPEKIINYPAANL